MPFLKINNDSQGFARERKDTMNSKLHFYFKIFLQSIYFTIKADSE
jgi:hypothetical protein